MTGLESASTLLLAETARSRLLLLWSLILIVWLTPIAVKVPRRGASMARWTFWAIQRSANASLRALRELETTAIPDGRLASTVGTCSDVPRPMKTEPLGGFRLLDRLRRTFCRVARARDTRNGELETGCCPLLLRQFGRLLCLRQRKRMASLMTAAYRTTSPTSLATILAVLATLWVQIRERRTGSAR